MANTDHKMSGLANTLKSFVNFTDSELQQVLLHFIPLTIKRGDSTLQEGDICTDMFFVNTGCMMLVTNKKQKGKIIELFSQGFFYIEMFSFMNNLPSDFCIKAAADSELLCITKYDFFELDRIDNWRRFRFLLLETVCQYINMELISLKMHSNEERYRKLLDERPFLFQKVPLYTIANYLDMTPEGLSKLRKRLLTTK